MLARVFIEIITKEHAMTTNNLNPEEVRISSENLNPEIKETSSDIQEVETGENVEQGLGRCPVR